MKRINRQIVYLIFVLLVSVLMGTSVVWGAQEPEEKDTYAGLDVNFVALNALDQTFTLSTMRAKLGLVMFPDLVPTLSMESQFGFNLTDDTKTINGRDVTLWVSNYIGLYARAAYELGDIVTFYGLLGFATTQLDGNTAGLGQDTQSGVSLGGGAQFGLPFNFDGNIELMELVYGNEYDILMFSLGVSYKM